MKTVFLPQMDDLISAIRTGGGGGGGGGSATAARYRIVRLVPEAGKVQLEDRAVNRMEIRSGEPLKIAFPPEAGGEVRDFFVRLVVLSDEIPEVSFVAPTGETISFEDADENALKCDIGVNVFAFTEMDSGIFIVNRKRVDVDVEVKFDPNGGALDGTTRVYKLGSMYSSLPTPTMDGMVFDGWFTDAGGGVKVSAYDRCKSGVTKLFAHWSVYVDPFAPAICPGGGLVFTTDRECPWTVDEYSYSTEPGSARSGGIGDNGSTSLHTTVSGAGTLSFRWRVSSEVNYDWLAIFVDGVLLDQISGSTDWDERHHALAGEGTHEVEWRYYKDGSCSEGSDCGWVDCVAWTPGTGE